MEENQKDVYYDENFTKPIIRMGRFTNLFAILLSLIPAFVLWIVYDAFPGLDNIVSGWFLIFSIYGVFAVVEPISYFPVLGIAGTYMSFLAGNIANVRMPASSVAQEVMKAKPGTKRAELISVQAIAGSIVTSVVVASIAAFGGAALMSIFPPAVLEAFNYVTPSLFGALFVSYFIRRPKIGGFAIILASILLYFFSLPSYLNILIPVFGTVAFAFLTEKE